MVARVFEVAVVVFELCGKEGDVVVVMFVLVSHCRGEGFPSVTPGLFLDPELDPSGFFLIFSFLLRSFYEPSE